MEKLSGGQDDFENQISEYKGITNKAIADIVESLGELAIKYESKS